MLGQARLGLISAEADGRHEAPADAVLRAHAATVVRHEHRLLAREAAVPIAARDLTCRVTQHPAGCDAKLLAQHIHQPNLQMHGNIILSGLINPCRDMLCLLNADQSDPLAFKQYGQEVLGTILRSR